MFERFKRSFIMLIIQFTIASAGQLIVRSERMRLPSTTTNRYLYSFIPQAILFPKANYNIRGDIHILGGNHLEKGYGDVRP